jgi:GT2 family glycosyltransferase
MLPRIAVVVPTCRRPELLSRCLTALSAQTLDRDEYELIVADDEASPRTRALVSERFPWVRYVGVDGRHGPSAARNAGWRVARAPVVAFTDDDCEPDPGWLAAGLECFRGGVVAAWGRVLVPLPRVPTDYERDAAGLERAGFVTANCFCRRDVLAELGGFDERFSRPWREDSDLFFRLLRAGALVVRVDDAVVVHPVRRAPWGVSLLQQSKSAFDALLFKKHRRLYRFRIAGGPPWLYYAIAVAAALAVGGWWTAAPAVAWTGLAVWALLTARFCARRLAATRRTFSHVAEMVVTSALIPPVALFWRWYGAARFRVLFL